MQRVIAIAVLLLAPAALQAQTPIASGTINATDGKVTIRLGLSAGTVSASLTGSFTATANFEVSPNTDCSSATAQPQTRNLASSALGSTSTATGLFLIPAAGFQCVQVRANPYTSGTITVVLSATPDVAGVSLNAALPTGANTIGGVNLTQYTPASGRLPVDGSGVTQPVSGTVTATQTTGTNLHIVCDSGCSSSAGFADNGAFTFGTTAINPLGGVLDDVATNVATENSAAIARITAQKGLHVNLRNNGGTEIGTSATPMQVSLANTAANATAVKVDGSAVTQPVSGTVTSNIGTTNGLFLDATYTGRMPAGASPATGESNTSTSLSRIGTYNFIYNGSTWDRWTGAVTGTVTANIGTTNGLALDTSVNGFLLSQGSTTSGQKGPLTQGAVATANPSYTNGQTSPFSLDVNGGLRVSIISGAGSGGTALADRASFTYGATSFTPVGGVYNSSITALTSGQAGVAALTPTRDVHVTLFDVNGSAITPSTDAVDNTAVPGSGPQIFGYASAATPSAVGADGRAKGIWLDTVGRQHIVCDSGCSGTTVGQTNRANSLPVTVAYDQGPVPFNELQLNGWPIPTGPGLSTKGTQRVALSTDSIVFVNPGAGLFTQGINVSGSLRGTSGLALGTIVAPTMAIVDGSGNQITSFGGGTQYANGAAQATPTGTVALGWDGANVRALSTNASGQLNVIFPSAQAVTQSGAPWSENITQFGGTNVATGTGASGAGIPRVTVANDSNILATQSGSWTSTVTQGTAANLNATVVQGNAGSNAQAWWTRIGDTTNGPVAVKAASTAAGATDPALVVAISPNNTVAVTQSTSPWVTNISQFGGSNVVTGTGTGGAGIPRMTVSSDSSLTANIGTTNGLALDATLTGRLPAGGSPADNESNTNTSLSRIGTFTYVYDTGGGNWDRWTGAVSQTGGPWTQNLTQVGSSAFALGSTLAVNALPVTIAKDDPVFAALMQTGGAGKFASAYSLRGSFGRTVTSTGDALDVNVKYPPAVTDPCQDVRRRRNIAISQTASAVLLSGAPTPVLFCSIFAVGADAENISVVEGTGTTCGTGTAAIIGGTSAANGPNFAANGGWVQGTGAGTVALSAKAGNDICLLQSGAGRVAGNATIVFLTQ